MQLRKTRWFGSNAGSIPTVHPQIAAKRTTTKNCSSRCWTWAAPHGVWGSLPWVEAQQCPAANIFTGPGCFRGAVPTRVSGL